MVMILRRSFIEETKQKMLKLMTEDQKQQTEYLETVRPQGVSDDNPEYEYAFNELQMTLKKINDCQEILSTAVLFNPPAVTDGSVSFGTTVVIKNLDTSKQREFTICSTYETNVENGLISIESPIAKKMLGLEKGDTFELNDIDYEIISVKYLSQV